ncbi:MAG: type II toxin-antitoxin system RelE/ParE family toxin [Gemmatimonadetes bacterium]|nr:type II toxin-antitoxin system RelE/ParE family toxin [Gemmatimonadota bacterium]
MTSRVVFRREARAEVRAARKWYDEQVEGLGDEFSRTLDATVAAIASRPRAFPLAYGAFHQCVMRRFPYALFFRIRDDEVIIIAVHHQRRDPESWRARTS